MDRREFLKTGGILSAGAVCAGALPVLPLCRSVTSTAKEEPDGLLYGMVIDLAKCKPGCTACMAACRQENNVAYHGDPRWDVHLIRKVKVKREWPVESTQQEVLLLCNHCDDPPCAQACPVQATYKRPDGVVIVDQHRCIGCRYCMIACPYNARHFNYKESDQWPNPSRPRSAHGVPESCNLCVHRLDRKEPPACVAKCEELYGEERALFVGNLEDLNDEAWSDDVREKLSTGAVKALREDLGTKPKVYYIGL